MIPREILKKIRQIEIRTNRIAIRKIVSGSFQPLAQLHRITRTMKDRNDANKVLLNSKKDTVLLENVDSGPTDFFANCFKSFRICKDALKSRMNLSFKAVAQSSLLRFIPDDRIFKFKPRLRIKNYFAGHERDLIRSFNSARTVSHGIPLEELRRNSSPRRSNSAICSGVSSSSNLPRNCSNTSRWSATGSLSICSRTWAALMLLNLTGSENFASA